MLTEGNVEAIVCARYGPPEVLQLARVEKPAPKDNEVLIRVHATTATTADGLMRRAETVFSRLILGFRRPRRRYRVLGIEVAGEIERIGSRVSRFEKGDQVYGFTGFRAGAYAEYCCMEEDGSLQTKPVNLSYEEAASIVDGSSTALYFLRDRARIRAGDKVLVVGASGSIGTAAVQLAKYFRATVTGVCSGANADLVKSLGADEVIDYTREAFTETGERYDIIFDTIGKHSFAQCKDSLTPNGRYLLTTPRVRDWIHSLWRPMIGGRQLVTGMSIRKREALAFLKDRIEAGELKPVIDRHYPLHEIAEAHRYVDQGHKRGNVVIQVRD